MTAVDRQLGYRAIVAWWSPPTCGVTTIRPIDEGVTAIGASFAKARLVRDCM